MARVSAFLGPVAPLVPVVPVVLAALFATTALPAQQPFRSGVSVVELDVAVLDRARQPVRGLTLADFEVFEDGVRQPIVTFEPIDRERRREGPRTPGGNTGVGSPAREADIRRHVVIVIDDAHMPFDPGIARIAKRVAHDVLDQLRSDETASVVYTFLGRNQNFTSDRNELSRAVDSLVPHPMSVGCLTRSPRCDVDTLTRVASMLTSAPRGRKIVIFISGGRSLSGPTTEEDQVGLTNQSLDLADVRELFRRLQETNAVIYGFDPLGLQTYGFSAEMAKPKLMTRPANESLHSFAQSTGGRAVTGTNRPWEHVRAVFEENSAYYLLGFQSTKTVADGRFRRIRVNVKRQDVDVRTRSGYFANSN